MKSSSNKRAVIFFIVAITVTFVLRFVQIIADVDKVTGILHSSAVNGIFAPITLAISLVIGIVLYILSPKSAVKNPPDSKLVAISSLLVSLTVIYDSISNCFLKKAEYQTAMLEGITKAEVTTYGLLQSTARIQMAFAMLSALYLFITAIGIFRNKPKTGNFMGILSVFLPLWCCIRLATDYIELTNSSILTEKIYDSLTICAMALFFMANIRVFSKETRGNTVRFMTATGLLTVIMAVVFPLPRFLFIMFADYNITATSLSFNLVNLAVAFYIVTYITRYFEEDSEKSRGLLPEEKEATEDVSVTATENSSDM